MERVVARLRLAVILLAGAAYFDTPPELITPKQMLAFWGVAVLYAGSVVLFEPYRRLSVAAWNVASGFFDWGLITLGIVVTGVLSSDLHLLYFISVLSIAMRFGLREVIIVGLGTAAGYVAIAVATGPSWSMALHAAGMRMGFLILFAVGSGVLARAAHRYRRAHIREEARRIAVQEVTAIVSHDLKNPLAAITGLVDLLLDSAQEHLSLDDRALLHRINANTQQMNHLVSNLLDVELMERGEQCFRPAAVDVNALVRGVVEAQAHQAEVKHVGLVLDLGGRIASALWDGRMVERLVANLVSNALKFTPKNGAVRVSTRQQGARIAIEVWDSGPDVPAALESTLFDKFVRQNDSPGIGLGLYICKTVADLHRGTIAVQRTGGGVAFVAELPVAAQTPSANPAPEMARSRAPEVAVWQTSSGADILVRG